MHTGIMRKQTAGKSISGHSGKLSARRDRSDRPGATTASSQRIGDVAPRGKTRLTMYLDLAVVEYFRSRSGGRGYQTLINETLKQAIEQENLEDVLRRVIREEARPYQVGKDKT
jgi:uncharacterized protein (DUF4415 family)